MALTMFCTAAVSKDEEEDLCHASSEEEQRMSLIKQQTAQRFLNELSFWEVESRTDSDSASSQRQEEEKERKKQEPGQWKTAMDPNSGRTYYYHSVTRQTQWEKPAEIRAAEKRIKQEKRRQDRLFFDEMERNIYKSLERKERIPGVPAPQQQQLLPQETLPDQQPRVRTISGMDENLLMELSAPKKPKSILKSTMTPSTSTTATTTTGRPPLPKARQTSREDSDDTFCLSPDEAREKFPPLTHRDSELELAGEHLLDGPIDESIGLDGLAENANNKAHVRRNTGSTIYVKSTMTNPDIQATIKCVCGVYRAHILQASEKRSTNSPVSVNSYSHDLEVLEIFQDQPESRDLPSLADITAFYQDFYERSQMEHDTIIMSLIYVERLIKETNGLLAPVTENWKSILFACMVMASKVWDDLSMWNVDFSNVCGRGRTLGLASFTLRRINELELAVLKSLNFNVKVPASEYAKYYFLIRSMLIKSGLLDEMSKTQQLDMRGAQTLETLSANYQDAALSAADMSASYSSRRTKSLNDYEWLSPDANDKVGPVLQQSVCLEQLVTMYR